MIKCMRVLCKHNNKTTCENGAVNSYKECKDRIIPNCNKK